eukprot:10340401-Ditylum_brightwellii.AAC.1
MDINNGTVYAGRPIGNNPDLNALDCHANQYIHGAVEEHCTYNAHLDQHVKRKFSMSTPKELERSYICLWDIKLQSDHPMKFKAGVPSS